MIFQRCFARANFQPSSSLKAPHGSSTFFEAENINGSIFRRMADSVARSPLELTEDGIAEGIRAYVERTGKSPHCKTPWIEELGIAGRALDMRLRHRHSCLADVAAKVANRPRITSLADIEEGILAYYQNTGTWPTSRTGDIHEIGLNASTINSRLKGMGTSIGRIVARLKEITMPMSA